MVIGVDQRGVMAGQAVENGFEARLGLDELVAWGHQFGVAFLDGAARLGLKDAIHLLTQFEDRWVGLLIVAPEGVLELAMPARSVQGMEDALMMHCVGKDLRQGFSVILVHIRDEGAGVIALGAQFEQSRDWQGFSSELIEPVIQSGRGDAQRIGRTAIGWACN